MRNNAYEQLAAVYDRLNAEVDYAVWADYIETAFTRFAAARPKLVLDLGCGTGKMTLEMARRGYEMIGVDRSEEMLSAAAEKAREEAQEILFLRQDMRSFELYGTVDAALCCLDSLNYLLQTRDLAKTFSLVHNYLNPDGLFLFDMQTPYQLAHGLGDHDFILEDAGVYCGWQNQYHPDRGICDFYLTLFTENPDGTYRRAEEHQRERAYSAQTIRRLLREAGFTLLAQSSDYQFTAPDEDDARWYFIARAEK